MHLEFLHTNDFHGKLDEARLAWLRPLREQSDLYFDNGDLLTVGNLGVPLRPDPAWTRLAELACTASVIGNRETHLAEAAFRAKLAGAGHPVMCANLRGRDGAHPLPGSLVVDSKGMRLGILAVSVAMVTERMAARHASAYLWDPPLKVAIEQAENLRPQCDLLIALTHIGYPQDRKLAESGAPIDLIFGGHSHTVLEAPEKVGRAWIAHAGSHGRFAGRYRWDGERLTGRLVPFR